MPIYEFFCDSCNVIFNFFSRRIDTTTAPSCPRCGKEKLSRQMSTFATIGKAAGEGEESLNGLDEAKMEQAFGRLMQEAEGMNEEDPRQ
ncbi:MAG TPA: zinc ribbon domain-containing protein, partial [Desulfoprunum sp.]|nr:zinc ribbon domain-containing protein [Desulfoprunum sp.]